MDNPPVNNSNLLINGLVDWPQNPKTKFVSAPGVKGIVGHERDFGGQVLLSGLK